MQPVRLSMGSRICLSKKGWTVRTSITEGAMLGLALPGMSDRVLLASEITQFTLTEDVEIYPLLEEIPPPAQDLHTAVSPEYDWRCLRIRIWTARLRKNFTPAGPSIQPEHPAEVMHRPGQEYRTVGMTATTSTMICMDIDSTVKAPLQGKRGRNYSHNDIPVINYHMDRAAGRMR